MKKLALSPNNQEVLIYEISDKEATAWKLLYTLVEHDSYVSGIDWSVDNVIVTCGHDRNAYVWNFEQASNTWKPSLVILRISRAATAVKWSPSGKKFAVASGAKLVPVCHYESENNWWVSNLIKKHKSTILSVAWHPNSKFLLTGGVDFKARIFSAYLEDIEQDVDADTWAPIFPDHNKFGELLWECDVASGWIESVAWSPSGNVFGFTAHDSTLSVATIDGAAPEVVSVGHGFLPFLAIAFLSENTVLCAGYNSNGFFFTKDPKEGTWVYADRLDKEAKVAAKAADKSDFKKNIDMFKKSTTQGVQVGKDGGDTALKTVHQNSINQITAFFKKPGVSTLICTTGTDGRVEVWDVSGTHDLGLLKLK